MRVASWIGLGVAGFAALASAAPAQVPHGWTPADAVEAPSLRGDWPEDRQALSTVGQLRAGRTLDVGELEARLRPLLGGQAGALRAWVQAEFGELSDPCADQAARRATPEPLVERMLRHQAETGNRWTKREARDIQASVDDRIDALVGELLAAADVAGCRTQAALANVGPEQRLALRGAVTAALAGVPDAEAERLSAQLSQAWRLVDVGGLLLAGLDWIDAVDTAADALAAVPAESWPSAPVILPTDLGEVWLGSPGTNSGTGDPVLLVDPGGDDQWSLGGTRSWAAAEPLELAPVRGWIDLGGDDTWNSGDVGVGGAWFGVAAGVDGAGDDVHRGGWLGQGAAGFGVASWSDRGGSDVFDAEAASQGFAAFGVGALSLAGSEGDRVYAKLAAQGAALPGGLALLVGGRGEDRYDLGEPAALGGQGAALGFAPGLEGGVALLLEHAGDRVSARTWAQGAAHRGGLGVLRLGDGHAVGDAAVQGSCAGSGLGLVLGAVEAVGSGMAVGPCRAVGVAGPRRATGPGPWTVASERARGAGDGGSAAGAGDGGSAAGTGSPSEPRRQRGAGAAWAEPELGPPRSGAAQAMASAPASTRDAWQAGHGYGSEPELKAVLAALRPLRPHEHAFARGVLDGLKARGGDSGALLLGAMDPSVEALRLRWLAEFVGPATAGEAAALAMPQLPSDQAALRAAAYRVLAEAAAAGATPSPGVVVQAAARLAREPDPDVRAAIARLLAVVGDGAAASSLAGVLDKPGLAARQEAEDGLVQLARRGHGDAVARAAFVFAEQGEAGLPRQARAACLRVLGHTGHAEAWEVLQAALTLDDELLVNSALEGAVTLLAGLQGKAREPVVEALQARLAGPLSAPTRQWLEGALAAERD